MNEIFALTASISENLPTIPQKASMLWTEYMALLAAVFSAVAAGFSWRTAHRTALESVRPHLVLSEFRINRIENDLFTFEIGKSVNHGKGPAFDVRILFSTTMWNTQTYGNGLEAERSVRYVECLAEKHEKQDMGELFRFKRGDNSELMNLRVRYKDSMDTQFETIYHIFFAERQHTEFFQIGMNNLSFEIIAPGVTLEPPRTTRRTSFARLWAKIDGGRWSKFQKKRKMLKG